MMADERNIQAAEAEATAEAQAQAAAEEAVAATVAEGAEELDISEKLKNAAGNIRRAGAGARSRRSESEKSKKRSEAEAQARLEETEKKLKDDEERARLVAEQKLAALDYAHNYRKKLQKDRQKAMSAAKAREKAEREAEEALAKEQRAKEIADLLEKERIEARERGEKATELLNRVTKCAVVDENGNLRMVDKIDLLKEKSEAEKADAEAEAKAREAAEAERLAEEAKAKEAREAALKAKEAEEVKSAPVSVSKKEAARREVEEFLEGEMMRVDGDSYVLDIIEDDMTVSLTDKDDPSIIPADMIGKPEEKKEEEPVADDSDSKLASAFAEHEAVLKAIQQNTRFAREEMKRMLDEEQERFAAETEALKAHRDELARIQSERRAAILDEIAALNAAPSAAPAEAEEPIEEEVCEAEEPIAEEVCEAEEENAPSYEPIVNNDPVVLALRARGGAVSSKRQLKKYVKKSNKAIKKIEKNLLAYEEARRISDQVRSRTALCYSMNECGKILEIRCDNLSAAARIRHDKLTKKLRLSLYSEIERYNRKATEFALETGEALTRVSAFLPDHLTNATGKAVIPVLAYRDRYEQHKAEDPEMPKSYLVSFPSVSALKSGESTEAVSSVIAVGGEKKNNPVTTKTIVAPMLYERDLLAGRPEGVSKKSFKQLRKRAKKAYKAIDKQSKKLGAIASAEAAVADLLLAREKVLVGSRVLVDAVKLDNEKWIGRARLNLEELFGVYNNKAGVCERICKTPITKIHPLTSSKVAEAMLVPDMPEMVHVNELFETVGDTTRIVGDPSGKKADDPDGSFTFLVGGLRSTDLAPVSASLAVTETSPAANIAGAFGGTSAAKVNQGHHYSVKGMPYPPMCIGVGSDDADAAGNSGSEGTADCASDAASCENAAAGGECASVRSALKGKELAAYRKKSDGDYKVAKQQLADINLQRAKARGDERVELDVRALTVEKELIDTLADSVCVAGASADKKLLMKTKKKLIEEIDAHNELVDDLGLISGVRLSRVSDTLYDDIISGNGYQKTPKIEYQVVEQPSNQIAGALGADDGQKKIGALSGKELKRFESSAEKSYQAKSSEAQSIVRSAKGKGGREKVELDFAALKVEKSIVNGLCESIAVANASGDKAYCAKAKKRLDAAVREHNRLVDDISAVGGASLTKVPENLGEDILAGKAYSGTPDIEYRTETTSATYPVSFTDKDGKIKRGEVVEQIGAVASFSGEKMSKKMYSSYVSDSEKAYKSSIKTAARIKSERKGASGESLIELETKELSARKENVDRLCENLSVAVVLGDKKLEKTAKARLRDEIKEHNALVHKLEKDGGVKLTAIPETVCDDIVAGKGYRKTAKLEYSPVEADVAHAVSVGASSAPQKGKLTERQAAEAILLGTASTKVLNNYIKKHNKSYINSKREIENLGKANKSTVGEENIRGRIEQLAAERLLIDDLCEGLAVASSSGNSSYAKTAKKRLSEQIKNHNAMVEELNRDGNINLATVSESIIADIEAGRGYRKTASIKVYTSQGETVQQVVLAGAGSALSGEEEKCGSEMTKKELKRYKAESNKSYKSAEKRIAVIDKSREGKNGTAAVEADVERINAHRERIDMLCRDTAVAKNAGDKVFAKSSAKKLTAQIKEHNELVDAFNKSGNLEISKLDEGMVKALLNGEGYTKTPKLNLKNGGSAAAYRINTGADNSTKMLNLTTGSISYPELAKKDVKQFKKNTEKSYKLLSDAADDLAKSRKTAVGGEMVDLDIKNIEVRRELIDGLCDTVAVANASGDEKLLSLSKKRLSEQIKKHNDAVDDLYAVGGITLTKLPADLYSEVVSGKGYRRAPKINLEVAEYAPDQHIVYSWKNDNIENVLATVEKNDSGAAKKQLSKKQISRTISENEKTVKRSMAQKDDLLTKNKAAVGLEKHQILVSLLNAQRSAVEAEASTLALLCAQDAGRKKISKQIKKVNAGVNEYNELTKQYREFTGDELSLADDMMAQKIAQGQPFKRIKALKLNVINKGYEYSYADYVAHDNKKNEGKDLAVAKSQAEAEKQNAVNYELASLKNMVKRQADKDNRTVASAFMYAKGLVQCEEDSRNYSYGLSKSVSKKKSDDIVERCKKIDTAGKRAINAENEANKRYYEVVTTNPENVSVVGKKRRWKLLPFFKKKYTTQDVVYLRDEIMKLLNERDRINGQLISIYEGQVMDLGGKPLTLEIRQVKAGAAKKMYNSKSTKLMAKKVDKNVVDAYDRNMLYGYINDQIEAESNIAVIDFRLKHAKEDNLTEYEIKQLKYDRKAQHEAKSKAEAQFKRTYKRCSENSDYGLAWLLGLGALLLVVVGVAAGLAWFFGPDLLTHLKTWFGIGG